ncbi:MAG: hypothetical protein OEY56_04625, partial [Cyclobacteriaceae bacterium]|nr:hypothetical protein [Cyclobacteriaceae bacterium]
MASAMMGAIKKIVGLVRVYAPTEHSYMNMVVSDGHLALAVRFTTNEPEYADSLYLNLGRKYSCEGGVCYMHDPGEHEKAVIISSEPLSKDPGWEPVPVNTMVLVQEGRVRDRMEIGMEF